MMIDDGYKEFDTVVQTIFTNVLVERKRCGKIILFDFEPDYIGDKLYFNVAELAADICGEVFYVDMDLVDYIKFKFGRGRKQKNLRWLRPWVRTKLKNEDKISVYMIMNFIKEQLNLDDDMFEKINDAYYGWGKE